MKENLWLTVVTCLAYCPDKELWKAIEYLREQVRILKEQREKQKRILLDRHQKIRLAARAKRLTRKTTWRQFLMSHWNVLAACDFFSIELLVRGKLVRGIVLFAIELATRRVEILGVYTQPNGDWMEQVARNVTAEGAFPSGKRYLIHDRDPLYTDKFDSILKAAGVNPVRLPARSPNLNAHAERFVRSIKEECLDHLILSSEDQLRYVLGEYLQYYHHERIHQGVSRIIEPRHGGNHGDTICVERLGGLSRSYHRKAA